jgi:hypothetical protein
MDPNATLRRIMELLDNQCRSEAPDALRDLADWLDRGGFFPHAAMMTRTVDQTGDNPDGIKCWTIPKTQRR